MTKRTPLLLGRQQMHMTPVRQKGKLSLELRRRLGCAIVFCVNRYKNMVNAVNETPAAADTLFFITGSSKSKRQLSLPAGLGQPKPCAPRRQAYASHHVVPCTCSSPNSPSCGAIRAENRKSVRTRTTQTNLVTSSATHKHTNEPRKDWTNRAPFPRSIPSHTLAPYRQQLHPTPPHHTNTPQISVGRTERTICSRQGAALLPPGSPHARIQRGLRHCHQTG